MTIIFNVYSVLNAVRCSYVRP